jgi:uncharacterized protein YunC (DUF1805 family)
MELIYIAGINVRIFDYFRRKNLEKNLAILTQKYCYYMCGRIDHNIGVEKTTNFSPIIGEYYRKQC